MARARCQKLLRRICFTTSASNPMQKAISNGLILQGPRNECSGPTIPFADCWAGQAPKTGPYATLQPSPNLQKKGRGSVLQIWFHFHHQEDQILNLDDTPASHPSISITGPLKLLSNAVRRLTQVRKAVKPAEY